MRIIVNRDNDNPIYIQIFEQIKQQILSGELLPGFKLPPERKLAESLGVNRSTVLNAYRQLKAEGLVGSHVGQGTVVLSCIEEESSDIKVRESFHEPVWNQIFSQYSNGIDSLIVNDLLALANRKDVISFATGIASPQIGPIEALTGIEEELVMKKDYKALMHSPTEGFSSMREAVCKLMYKKGLYCEFEEVMMLSGSQQGIDLAARVILNPGDIVVAEEPSYFPAIQAFKAIGARVIGIPIDEGGMRIEILEQLLQRYRPKLIYTIPTFQNPSGTEMELERRKELVKLAQKYKIIILEDDAYSDLRYDGKNLPTLKSMDNEGYVIYLNTFSKNVYSGLRLGWIVAHREIIKKFVAAKQIMDLHSSSLSQWIIERFIINGGLEKHIPYICNEYKLKRDVMDNALLKYGPKNLIWKKPNGGYYIWCKLPSKVSASKLMVKAAEKKVVFVPGTPFFSTGKGEDFIRLNFTFVELEDIKEGVKKLCEAMDDVIKESYKQENYSSIDITPVI